MIGRAMIVSYHGFINKIVILSADMYSQCIAMNNIPTLFKPTLKATLVTLRILIYLVKIHH